MLPGVVTSLVAHWTKPRCQLLIVTLLVKVHECTNGVIVQPVVFPQPWRWKNTQGSKFMQLHIRVKNTETRLGT